MGWPRISQRKQNEEESMKVGLRRMDVLCLSKSVSMIKIAVGLR